MEYKSNDLLSIVNVLLQLKGLFRNYLKTYYSDLISNGYSFYNYEKRDKTIYLILKNNKSNDVQVIEMKKYKKISL